MNLIQVLNRPYPATDGKKYMLRDAVVGGVFVTLFLFFFRPFGMNSGDLSQWMTFLVCFQYGLVTFCVGVLWGIFVHITPNIFNEQHWTVWREILASLAFVFCIAVGNMWFTHLKYGGHFNWQTLIAWIEITFSVGIFPIVLGVLLKEIRLAKRFGQEAIQINTHLHETHPVVKDEATVTLTGDNQNEYIKLKIKDLLYLEAADNYVVVVYQDNGSTKQKMLRSPLKKMEDLLAEYPECYRCHRAYIVNLQQVVQISGNAQGYKLHLEATTQLIPVSRALNDTIRNKLG